MNDGVLLSLDFVDARAFSLSLSALSALSLSLSVDLQTTTLLGCASKKKKTKKSVFFLETTTTTTKAWTTARSIRDARDVFERLKRNTLSEGVSVKQRVSKEDVLVSSISKDGEFSVVETFETPSKADEEFRTMVEIVLKKKNDEEGERADERTVASVLAHALAMLARESAFSRGKEEEERECDIFDVVLKSDGRSLATIEGEDWNRTMGEEDEGVDGGVGDVVDDRMMEKDGVVSHADIVAKADFKGCEVTLVFSRTKEAELRIGNDTRGTASSWIREEENAGKKDIRVKKTFSLNPTRIESEESKALDVLFQLPSHFWSKFGFHPIRRLRRRRKEEEDTDEEVNDEDVTENDDVSFFRVFDTPEFGTYVYDCDSDDEGDQDDDTGKSAAAQGAEEDDGVDLEEEMELLDLRKQVQELPDFAAMKTNEEEMDAHNVQHLQELYLRDVCVVWRQSKENKQRQQLTSPSLPERFRTCFEKAFMEAKRKNRPNFTSKRERKEWRIGERIMHNAANIYRNAVVNTDLMIDVAKADENIEDWEGKICTLLCQKRAFGQIPLQAQQQKQKQKQ